MRIIRIDATNKSSSTHPLQPKLAPLTQSSDTTDVVDSSETAASQAIPDERRLRNARLYSDRNILSSTQPRQLAQSLNSEQEVPREQRHKARFRVAAGEIQLHTQSSEDAHHPSIHVITMSTINLNTEGLWQAWSSPGDAQRVMLSRRVCYPRLEAALTRHFSLVLFAANDRGLSTLIFPDLDCSLNYISALEHINIKRAHLRALRNAFVNGQSSLNQLKTIICCFPPDTTDEQFLELEAMFAERPDDTDRTLVLTPTDPIKTVTALADDDIAGLAVPISDKQPFVHTTDPNNHHLERQLSRQSDIVAVLSTKNTYLNEDNITSNCIFVTYQSQVNRYQKSDRPQDMLNILQQRLNQIVGEDEQIKSLQITERGNLILTFNQVAAAKAVMSSPLLEEAKPEYLMVSTGWSWLSRQHQDKRSIIIKSSPSVDFNHAYHFLSTHLSSDELKVLLEQRLQAQSGHELVELITDPINGFAFMVDGQFNDREDFTRLLGAMSPLSTHCKAFARDYFPAGSVDEVADSRFVVKPNTVTF